MSLFLKEREGVTLRERGSLLKASFKVTLECNPAFQSLTIPGVTIS